MKKKLEERVASNEQKYRSIAHKFSGAVWVVNVDDLTYLYISPNAQNISGYSQDEVIGKHISSNMTVESYEVILHYIEKGRSDLKNGKIRPYNIEIEQYLKNGSTFWWEISIKFVQEKGEPLKAVGIARDITHRKKIEKDRDALIEKLKKTAAADDPGYINQERLIVVKQGNDLITFPVSEVLGIVRYTPEMIKDLPVTVAGSKAAYTMGILSIEDKDVGLLKDKPLFKTLTKDLE